MQSSFLDIQFEIQNCWNFKPNFSRKKYGFVFFDWHGSPLSVIKCLKMKDSGLKLWQQRQQWHQWLTLSFLAADAIYSLFQAAGGSFPAPLCDAPSSYCCVFQLHVLNHQCASEGIVTEEFGSDINKTEETKKTTSDFVSRVRLVSSAFYFLFWSDFVFEIEHQENVGCTDPPASFIMQSPYSASNKSELPCLRCIYRQ